MIFPLDNPEAQQHLGKVLCFLITLQVYMLHVCCYCCDLQYYMLQSCRPTGKSLVCPIKLPLCVIWYVLYGCECKTRVSSTRAWTAPAGRAQSSAHAEESHCKTGISVAMQGIGLQNLLLQDLCVPPKLIAFLEVMPLQCVCMVLFQCYRMAFCCVYSTCGKGIANGSTALQAFQRADTTLSSDPLNRRRKDQAECIASIKIVRQETSKLVQ